MSLGDEWTISAEGPSHGLTIADGGSTAGAELAVGQWTTTIGTWSVRLVGMPGPLLRRIRRGQLVVHEVAFPGWSDAGWEVVQVGTVASLDGSPGRWTLTMRDLLSALRSRPTLSEQTSPLFHSVGSTGTLSSYTAGDTTLTLASAGEANSMDLPSGGTGLVRCNVDLDTEFFLTFTGRSSNTLTGVSAAGQYGTTAVSGATTVADCAYVEDDPASVAAKILTSTGDATNGPYDVLPSGWGLGLPVQHLDREDLELWKPYTAPATGSDVWTMISTEEQTEGIRWLASWLARGGLFLTQRQGRLTVRSATNWQGSSDSLATEAVSFGRITGEHVIPDSIRWSAWGGGLETSYNGILVTSASSATASYEVQQGIPFDLYDEAAHDLSDTLYTNETAARAAVVGRLKPWECRLAERLELSCTHPLAAGLCPGDVVTLHLSYFGGRSEWQTGAYDGRPAMVVRVDPDFWGGRATGLVLAVAAYPPASGGA